MIKKIFLVFLIIIINFAVCIRFNDSYALEKENNQKNDNTYTRKEVGNITTNTYDENNIMASNKNIETKNNNYNKKNGIYKICVSVEVDKSIGIKGGGDSNNELTEIWDYRKCCTTKILF